MRTNPVKSLTSLVVAGLVVGLAGTGTASAAAQPAAALTAPPAGTAAPALAAPPTGKAAATANPLYKTGRLADSQCSPGDLPAGSTAAYRRFLQRVTNCLNKSWASQFKKAGLAFSKPRLLIVTKKVRTPCGPWLSGASGLYCSANKTMYMLITKQDLRRPFPVGITRLMAHEYGHHVQQMAGIWSYYWSVRSRAGKSAALQLSRRAELQAECFSSVFMSVHADTLPVGQDDWDAVVNWFRQHGGEIFPQNDHGTGASQAAWMKRGFAYGAPGACNTWTAGARQVA
ncbi:neutral zinc metallopeptidase [Thermoactinospora rubra]|uniref:neutral zinc metallopeptidase n=1 Tax=Thermoactinospora rubra TaxID=1088767 RepID=UPI000A10C8D1|nr:neutral zinc metallopeptidase [Thermoactinospora rubra]